MIVKHEQAVIPKHESVMPLECAFRGRSDYAGLVIEHDDASYVSRDRVLGVMLEEQCIAWELIGGAVTSHIMSGTDATDLIDVGTGSGVWALLTSRSLLSHGHNPRVMGLDVNPRAIKACMHNAVRCGLTMEQRCEPYRCESVEANSARAIFMNPPYHLGLVASGLPLHADGGETGFEVFMSWLQIARSHLAPGGMLAFHHMCVGHECPEFEVKMAKLWPDASIQVFDVLAPVPTAWFLGQLGAFEDPRLLTIAELWPTLYFCSGTLVDDHRRRYKRSHVDPALLESRTWRDRVDLHRFIDSIGVGDVERDDGKGNGPGTGHHDARAI